MVVEVTSIAEFFEELERVGAGRVVEKLVRVRVDRAAEQEDCFTFAVGVWGTAVLGGPDDGYFLLQISYYCGEDDLTDSEPDRATRNAAAVKSEIVERAKRLGLTVGPGRWEF